MSALDQTADLRSDSQALEARLLRWRENAKSEFAREMATDSANIVRKLREALVDAVRRQDESRDALRGVMGEVGDAG